MMLEGKVALVTGGGTGIGAAIVERFVAEGAKVCLTGRRADLLEKMVQSLPAGTAVACPGDVSDPADAQKMVDATVAFGGRLDALVNNAGIEGMGAIADLELAEWQKIIDIDLTGCFLMMKAAIPQMVKAGGGSIINIASVHGLVVRTRNVAYSTVKAGMLHLTRQMAVDYGPHNIRVNAICPGGTILPENEERYRAGIQEHPEQVALGAKLYPLLGRPAFAVEIARAALFLASDDAGYVTGNTLVLDGGMTLQIQDTLSSEIEGVVRGERR